MLVRSSAMGTRGFATIVADFAGADFAGAGFAGAAFAGAGVTFDFGADDFGAGDFGVGDFGAGDFDAGGFDAGRFDAGVFSAAVFVSAMTFSTGGGVTLFLAGAALTAGDGLANCADPVFFDEAFTPRGIRFSDLLASP